MVASPPATALLHPAQQVLALSGWKEPGDMDFEGFVWQVPAKMREIRTTLTLIV